MTVLWRRLTLNIVNYAKIDQLLTKSYEKSFLQEILSKARQARGLDIAEVAALLLNEDEEIWQEIEEVAREIKFQIYGARLVLFAPLYIANYCHNDCVYCAFRCSNQSIQRNRLTAEEIGAEVRCLVQQGHKRLLLVAGEETNDGYVDYLRSSIEATYAAGDIRRVNINVAPLTEEQFSTIRQVGIGTYQLFQETYQPITYQKMHPKGKKADYQWRITAFDRAIKAGIDDFGMGVLLGLEDYRFELLALMEHIRYLENKFGIGPHTISVPRWRPAQGALVDRMPYSITDQQMERIVMILRLAVPYTGIILSTRENPQFRDRLIHLGVSQLSAGSSTSPGGYVAKGQGDQFAVEDHRSLDDVVRSIISAGYLPSFCTACYRKERTGKAFMDLAKEGQIKQMCQINALLTLEEHLLDCGSESTRQAAEGQLHAWIEPMTTQERQLLNNGIAKMKQGLRDIYY